MAGVNRDVIKEGVQMPNMKRDQIIDETINGICLLSLDNFLDQVSLACC